MNYKEKLNHITTFIFDVDGVLTDGKILLHPSGEQIRSMNVKDGMAIREAIKKGYLVAIISGGKGGAEDKIEIMKSAGITISKSPADIGKTLYQKLNG